MIDAIGWVATALFASSYLFKQPVVLRRTQALAAALWIVYGAIIHATPVVAANLIVAGLALWSSFGPPARRPVPEPAASRPTPSAGDA
ncbi:MAG TPA: hypothetical protein VEH62_08835 [Gemmatimonadales bacterium]|nr:hypothetical protein [Gemmatimonadales bacterium]